MMIKKPCRQKWLYLYDDNYLFTLFQTVLSKTHRISKHRLYSTAHESVSIMFLIRIKYLIVHILITTALPWGLRAQAPDSFLLEQTLAVTARYATADNLGNTLIISTTNAVEKYAPDGRLLTRYTNNRLGTPGFLDASNPLKVLVWYPDFRTIVFLDRSGTALGELDLIAAGFPEVRVVAAARDGNLWLYDEAAFQVRKTSPEGEVLFESQNLSLLTSVRLNIKCLVDDGDQLYGSNTNEGLFILDAYAQSYRNLLIKGIGDFQFSNDKLLYINDFILHIEDLKSFASKKIPIPPAAKQEGNRAWLGPGRLFIQDGNFLKIFRF